MDLGADDLSGHLVLEGDKNEYLCSWLNEEERVLGECRGVGWLVRIRDKDRRTVC